MLVGAQPGACARRKSGQAGFRIFLRPRMSHANIVRKDYSTKIVHPMREGTHIEQTFPRRPPAFLELKSPFH